MVYWREWQNGRTAEWRTEWSNGGNGENGKNGRMAERQNGRMAEMATYVLFMVHAAKMAGMAEMAGMAGMAGMAERQKKNGRMVEWILRECQIICFKGCISRSAVKSSGIWEATHHITSGLPPGVTLKCDFYNS